MTKNEIIKNNLNNIRVIDNFFTEEIHHEISKLMDRPKWRLRGGNSENRFWHMDDLQSEDYFSHYLFEIIQYRFEINTKIKRIYANGQTAGQNGTAHADSDDDFSMTFLYYCNLEWKFVWGGHLTFLDMKSDCRDTSKKIRKEIHESTYCPVNITNSLSYVPNRAILFPSNIWHYAHPPHRTFTGLRTSLAYKLELL
tara:strand:+ start:199 stop:789 length:591 start_codon:yes stop_codon:yes gene_type:complete